MEPIDCEPLYRDGRHYDLQHRDFVDDIPFYVKQAERYGDPLLEIACGTGRITIPIAEKGLRITGLDVSKGMLAHAERKAAALGADIEWINADCRDFHLGRYFNLILFPFNSIAHLHSLADIEACFACVREHLAPGGHFIVDIFNPRLDILMRDRSGRYPVGEYPDPDGQGTIVLTENNVYDGASQVNRIKWYYRIGGRSDQITVDLNMRIFYPQELDALLKYNGYEIENKFGDFDESPFGSDSLKQIPVCYLR
jgi:SAM-dependent methyltransferase